MKHLLFLIAIAVCLTGCHSEKTELAKGSFDVDLYEFVDSNLAMSLDSIVANMPDSGMIDCNAYLIRYTDIPDTVFYHQNWPVFSEMPETLLYCDEPFLSNLSMLHHRAPNGATTIQEDKPDGVSDLGNRWLNLSLF